MPWPDRCFRPQKQSLNPAGLTLLLSPSMRPIQLLQKAPKLENRLPDYCAVTTFVYLLTTKGYNFNNHSFPNIAFRKKVGNARAHPHPMVSAWSQARKFCKRVPHQERAKQCEGRSQEAGTGWDCRGLGGSFGR